MKHPKLETARLFKNSHGWQVIYPGTVGFAPAVGITFDHNLVLLAEQGWWYCGFSTYDADDPEIASIPAMYYFQREVLND